MIEIEPVPNPDTGEVGDQEKRAALVRARQALARLTAGEPWEDVARTASDSGLAVQSGDLGWQSEESGYDRPFMEAVFAVPVNAPTDVVEGEDDVYRIGRATEIAPAEVDGAFQVELEEAGITQADYREVARADALREKLSDKVVADMSQPSLQRHVLEIFLPEPNQPASPAETGVKVRHILYAPKDDADGAEDLPADDPAWAAAKAEADAAFAALKSDPKRFDAMARADSDEPSARGIRGTGGKQPWYYPTSAVDPAFKDAIFRPGLTPGQLLEPVKTSFGWHVIEFMRPTGDGEKAWLDSLVPKATDEATFRQLAKDNSEGQEAGEGGDIGWVAKGQLVEQLETAVFGAAIGSNSSVITLSGDGDYLLRVLGEETRTPTEEQIAIFENSGFQYWYTAQKEAADIEYLLGTTEATG
jgi:parvulin-like peptidyl-prolyl isomerase